MVVAARKSPLGALQAFLIDLDGVVYRGHQPLPGAARFLTCLEQTGRQYRLVTNNSRLTAEQYVARLAGMGIRVPSQAIVTSAQATAASLSETYPAGARLLVIGEEGLVGPILAAGFYLDDQRPDCVVVGLDTRLTYQRLCRAAQALDRGARFVATNPDPRYPMETGFWPGCGAILAFLAAATGRTPHVVGKPNTTMLRVALDSIGAVPAAAAIIGDSLATDIVSGHAAGLTTLLVLSGVTTAEQAAEAQGAAEAPDYVFDDLAALTASLEAEIRLTGTEARGQ